jgi:hypothetical protein
MTEEPVEIRTTEQIPDDPLKMPPPFWRSSGAIFQLLDALREMDTFLTELIPIHHETQLLLADYLERHPNVDDPELEEFGDLHYDLWEIEHKVQLKSQLACLMSAIQAEDELNQFCVFNLHKDISESVEKLTPPEKLLVACAVVGQSGTKGRAVFNAIRKLSSWRNAFAHGHCVDRPTKSLRHNHLISPNDYPGVQSVLRDTIDLVTAFLAVSDHLKAISLNPYTAGKSLDTEEIRGYLAKLNTVEVEGNNYVYTISRGDRVDEEL